MEEETQLEYEPPDMQSDGEELSEAAPCEEEELLEEEALPQEDEPREEVNREYAALAREYPGIRRFPEEVARAVAAGETPLGAYRAYENRKLRAELEMNRKQAENLRKATGSASGEAAGDGDGLMAAFDSVFKQY